MKSLAEATLGSASKEDLHPSAHSQQAHNHTGLDSMNKPAQDHARQKGRQPQ